jgi:23S rRNA (cytosine1962-C5)-methyltransferase
MEQSFDKFLMFSNRLEKLNRHLGKQARRQNIGCYRLYDHDLPEFPFIIERYDDCLYVSEYKRRHALSEETHDAWITGCIDIMSEVLGISKQNIFLKLRQRKAGRQGQYQKIDEEKNEKIVEENGLKFIVNLSDYLDTGLFLDHRITRQMVRQEARMKAVLNLFCYTGSFSVYATAGEAASVLSVDLSKTYLNRAEKNMQLNFPGYADHKCIHADAREYLKQCAPESFDLVIMDPPTFSNSKRMEGILDIQKDHVELINDCLRILSNDGVLYFSTNYTRFQMDEGSIKAGTIKDITRQTTPFDFEGKLKRWCYRIFKYPISNIQ